MTPTPLHPTRAAERAQAFTLIEILIVLAILHIGGALMHIFKRDGVFRRLAVSGKHC